MKALDLQPGTRIYCRCTDSSTYVTFHHMDGMYALCKTEHGGIAYLYAMQDLTEKDGRLEVVGEEVAGASN